VATTAVEGPRVRGLPFGWIAAAVAAVQGVAFGLLAARGYFYQDDLDYTAQAAGRSLSPGYLLSPNNDHLAPGLRLAYWLIAHTAPYEHGLTVAARIAVQAVATLLFARLLARLYGPRPVAVVALAGYASAVLTLPSFLSLSSAVNLLPSHVAAVLLLDGWLRYQLTGRLRYAVTGAIALLVGLLFWEKMALAVLLLPLFTLTVLSAGPARDRWRALRSRWPGLLVCVAPVAAFAVLYLVHRPGNGPGPTPSAAGFLHLAWDSWGRSVAPAVAGGPWRWFAGDGVYVSVADPPLAGHDAGQLAVAALLVVAARRNGRSALLPWTMPLVWLLADVVVLGIGRYDQFGTVVGRTYHYLSDLTIPLVLAIATSLVPPRPAKVAGRTGSVTELPVTWEPPPPATWTRRLALAAVVVYAAGLVVSVNGFERRWVDNPTKAYLNTAVTSLRAFPGAQVYDTPVSNKVLTLLGEDRRLSQVLAPLGLDVKWDGRQGGEPLIIDDQGRLVGSSFFTEAQSREKPKLFCSHYLDGAGTLTVPLDRALPAGDRFVRVDYILSRGTATTLRLGSGARVTDPLRGARQELRAGLNGVLLQTAGAAVDRVEVINPNPQVKLCVTHVSAGIPVPAG
jgi:hypothetical protein